MHVLRIAVLLAAFTGVLRAETQTNYNQPPPPDVGWTQNLGQRLPLDAEVIDVQGNAKPFGHYFGDKPVIVLLGYNRCPMLCGEQIQGVLQVTHDLDWKAPEDFKVLFISVDPEEDPQLAREAQRNANRAYAENADADAWTFLRAGPEAITQIAQAAGFGYEYDEESTEYAHPGGFLIAEEDGTIAQYFFGVRFEGPAVRLALVDASQGKLGSPADQLLLLCYHYDPMTGKYGLAIQNLLKAGALATIFALGGFITWNLRRERQQPHA
ncbi:MAG: SCO family protein [Verrucomicrobiota bacterium JB022]|nr:SCO family protein [Verrucomicrobiota bacterium JB022]